MATPKRATIPGSTFSNSKASRVIGKLTETNPDLPPDPGQIEPAAGLENSASPVQLTVGNSVAGSAIAPSNANASTTTVKRSNSNTVIRQEGGSKADIKVTFYLTEAQADKLDELVFAYKKRRGKRINRNDIIRHLVDAVSVEEIEQAEIG